MFETKAEIFSSFFFRGNLQKSFIRIKNKSKFRRNSEIFSLFAQKENSKVLKTSKI